MRALADIVAPVRCVGCGIPADGELCAGCASHLDPLPEPICLRCGAPVAEAGMGACAWCEVFESFERARSLVRYGGPASRLTVALKHRGRPALARGAGALLADLARLHRLMPAAVTFVPGGRASRRRGFDHARLLATEVAAGLGVPCVGALVRTVDGPRQADVPLIERYENVRGRFAAHALGGRVLLVDDVLTTGATADACASALLGAGAEAVDVLTWARTPRRDR